MIISVCTSCYRCWRIHHVDRLWRPHPHITMDLLSLNTWRGVGRTEGVTVRHRGGGWRHTGQGGSGHSQPHHRRLHVQWQHQRSRKTYCHLAAGVHVRPAWWWSGVGWAIGQTGRHVTMHGTTHHRPQPQTSTWYILIMLLVIIIWRWWQWCVYLSLYRPQFWIKWESMMEE